MSALVQAVDRVYAAFADAPKPRAIEGCSHCIEAKDVDELLASPLREIGAGLLSSYASSAFLTVGSIVDYEYFLPRILEISINDDSWWPDIEVTGRAIGQCHPESSKPARGAALRQLLGAVIGDAVDSGAYHLIDGWICAIARMGLDVGPYLGQVARVPAAVLAYFEGNAGCLLHGKLCNAFWELPSPAHDQIVRWFNSPEVSKIPFDAYGYVRKPQV